MAFTGMTTAGNGIFLSDVSGATLRNITQAGTATNRTLTSTTQINNTNQVVAEERFDVDGTPHYLLRRWDGSAVNPQSPLIIAAGNFFSLNDFPAIHALASINNINEAAFNVQQPSTEDALS